MNYSRKYFINILNYEQKEVVWVINIYVMILLPILNIGNSIQILYTLNLLTKYFRG